MKCAIEDDIYDAIYTPRKRDEIEGKIEVVLRGIIENGVDVKVKLKQRRKLTKVCHDMYYSIRLFDDAFEISNIYFNLLST